MLPIRGNMALEIKLWNISINNADRTGKLCRTGRADLELGGEGGFSVELRPCDVRQVSLGFDIKKANLCN